MTEKTITAVAMAEVLPDRLTLLDIENISPLVLDYFVPWMEKAPNGELTFKSSEIDKSMLISQAGVYDPVMVRNHYLFYSAIEVLCFCNLNIGCLKMPGSSAFTLLGLLPVAVQIRRLQTYLPNAKVFTVLDNDLLGRTLDCKIALWSKNKDAGFFLHNGVVICNFQDRTYRFRENEFSLHRFEKFSGLRSGIRTYKPKVGFVSFAELHRHELIFKL